ncbi:MAG: Zn-ribbon domain-containing OB-fold protein [archaeon]
MTVPLIWRKIPHYYNLIGKKCTECNWLYFPPRDVCTKCGSRKLDNHKFNGIGEIVTYTIIRTPMPDPEEELSDIDTRIVPYILAIIKLVEGPKLTTEIVDCEPENIAIGKKVELCFRKLLEKGEAGVIQYGYKFRLAR